MNLILPPTESMTIARAKSMRGRMTTYPALASLDLPFISINHDLNGHDITSELARIPISIAMVDLIGFFAV